MTTAGTIVTAALREGNIIPIGQSPTANEAAEGLDVLNRYMLSLFSMYVGNKLRDWQVPKSQRTGTITRTYPLLPGAERSLVPVYTHYPPINSRIVWDGSEQTIYLPEKPQDGSVIGLVAGSGAAASDLGPLTVDANGRTIEGAATYTVNDTASLTPVRWFYRADQAMWREVRELAASDDMLFPPELDDLWICATCVRMAGRYGKTPPPGTVSRGGEMLLILKTRYAQSEPTGSGAEDTPNAYQSYPVGSRWMI